MGVAVYDKDSRKSIRLLFFLRLWRCEAATPLGSKIDVQPKQPCYRLQSTALKTPAGTAITNAFADSVSCLCKVLRLDSIGWSWSYSENKINKYSENWANECIAVAFLHGCSFQKYTRTTWEWVHRWIFLNSLLRQLLPCPAVWRLEMAMNEMDFYVEAIT